MTEQKSSRKNTISEKVGMLPPQEIWSTIIGYEGLYLISNSGRIKGLKKIIYKKGNNNPNIFPEIILKPILRNKKGYLFVNLYKNKTAKMFSIHILVAKHFIPNPLNKPQVNHKDGIKTNNNDWNLEWVTPKENGEHASKNGLVSRCFGESNARHKLTQKDVDLIRKLRYSGSRKEYSNRFSVNIKHIDRIRSGERWING